MRYQSNNNLRGSNSNNADLNGGNTSFYHSNSGQQQPKSSADLYKVYLNYQPPVGANGAGATMNS
jgi:hypothetical protein